MPRLAHAARLALVAALAVSIALPGVAQSGKPEPAPVQPTPPANDPALTCANLFNWVVRFGEALPEERQNRLQTLLSQIADPQVYSVPSPAECASVLQIMVQEGFDIADLGLREVAGVEARCDAVVPFVQQRHLSLDRENRAAVLGTMEAVNIPLYGRSDDLVACSILHGMLDRLNLFEGMQEF